jgi:tRNA-splicing ligase RtcB
MPDGHSGYGFPIGGVAAFDVNQGGVISPGGIGFDINCGMRLVRTNLTYEEVQPQLRTLVQKLFKRVPAGVGSRGFVRLSQSEFRDLVAMDGAQWAVKSGYGWEEELERMELHGKAEWATPHDIPRSIERATTRSAHWVRKSLSRDPVVGWRTSGMKAVEMGLSARSS